MWGELFYTLSHVFILLICVQIVFYSYSWGRREYLFIYLFSVRQVKKKSCVLGCAYSRCSFMNSLDPITVNAI